ncbi:TerC family protein [Hydrocarboniphaga sp.]|uniref:TerC family protein n=1 Tax=Hydrocarboniphaga sp. TaxID=2033016 RepID=UPI002623E502|nr:TerC family protein [Hydrocarboniphaga sp.]
MHDFHLDSGLLIAVLQIILIDILLGGDNAVVIALACRRLPPRQRNMGIFWGVFGAIGLRIVLIFFAVQLLALPFLKIVGALLLLYIGVQLLLPEKQDEPDIKASDHLLTAIRTIIIADAVMSLDNVIAIAGAADGHIGLVAMGIAISVPIIVWGSKLVMALMDRYPVVIVFGGALLGWIAGGLWIDDHALDALQDSLPHWTDYLFSVLGALLVVLIGRLIVLRRRQSAEA